MKDPPWFLWDVKVTDAELRERLRDPRSGPAAFPELRLSLAAGTRPSVSA
jgi:hypothetical protein